jgi:hypothetical protein
MAKFTRIELKPDDPIFWGGVQVFKPMSRPVSEEEESPSNPMQGAADAYEAVTPRTKD